MINTSTKSRAKRRFHSSSIGKMESVISQIKPGEKDHQIESRILLEQLKEVIKNAFKRGCSAEEVYQSFINNDVHLSKYAFFAFWRIYVENRKKKPAVNKSNKKTNKEPEKINIRINKPEINVQKPQKILSSTFEIKKDSTDI